jgi:hypothetical protein
MNGLAEKKEIDMSSMYSVAAVMDPARLALTRKFDSRLAITLLTTAFDIAAMVVVGPIAFQCAAYSAALPIAFLILAAAMLASLAHMWSLTLRIWKG